MGAATVMLFLAAAPIACDQVQQQLTGAKDQGPALNSLRTTLSDKRTRLSNAVASGNMDFVPSYLNDMKSTLDSLEAQAGKMSILDGQEMKLKVASARRAVTAAEPFIMQNDVEGVKGAQRSLDGILFEIDGILVKAIGMTDAPAAGGGS
jgi:hypothetical protein